MAHCPILREWAPLADLFSKLPVKTGGIFSQDIKLTCLDAVADFLVIGTNVGMIFWYNQKQKDLQRLRCENFNCPITFVKAVSTVDYMVASGNQSGGVSIFQIPKTHPEALPDSLKPRQKQVERYTVTELHKSPITSLEWSKNGMKLFSGDKTGSIVLTEIDFYMHVCKSIEILNESYEVVQLSYRQQHLLVSTTFRSILCHYSDKWKVCQVGKKDRKILGKFGGLIHQRGFVRNDIVVYCMRPGLRIWIADSEGEVQKTLLFKDLLSKECPQVPILNPISKNLLKLKPQKEAAFGIVHEFCEDLLITFSNDVVYILDPGNMSILATVNNLRSILDIATYKDELFILEEGRSLIRISYKPEFENDEIDVCVDNTVSAAEEARETFRDDFKTFDEISNQEFDDSILFKNSKRTKRKPPLKETDGIFNTHPDFANNYTTPTIMNISTLTLLPDLRSPESITNDIREKEKMLSDILNLDKLQISVAAGDAKETEEQEDLLIDKFTKIIEDKPVENVQIKAKTPVVHIPNDWKISSIEVATHNKSVEKPKLRSENIPIPKKDRDRRSSSTNDSSLSDDWEIV